MHCLVALSNIWSIILHINKHVFLKIMEISQYNEYGIKCVDSFEHIVALQEF